MEDNSKHPVHILGRYGEMFVASQIDEDNYSLSCDELNITNTHLSKKEYDEYIHKYVEKGELNIDRSNPVRIMNRAANMGKQLSRYYHLFEARTGKDNTSSLHLAVLIAQILRDSEVLELDDEKYVDWFLTHGAIESQEYIDLMLLLKEKVK